MTEKRFPIVKIINVGTLSHEASETASTFNLQLKSDLGIGGGSTVTFIEADQKILVDTGFDYEWVDTLENNKLNARNLRWALHRHGISPGDIDIAFITHWHKDHFGNLRIFKKARYMASSILIKQFKLAGFTAAEDGEEIADGVKIMFTPGHTTGHASLLVDTVINEVKARIAIAGDAVISHSYFQSGFIWKHNADFYDADKVKQSISRLIQSSDVIIPGHGVPFMTYTPDWLKN